ncbi:hypothetical protein [Rufibacter latericius]|uniref:DUF3267 domain-containing protein n=1 Tax=Rufibacter latericius TaxID=2487040 RepID=A0A3M9N1P6_9BACT|nr:hypothetical protein [Rufibacter latericius]RNI31315.1 hypothetical protein EFB08_01965 [Rufibacter latericius]
MRLHLTPKNTIAFLALLFICHELHELVHILTGYFLCGCFGTRDFEGWEVCTACPPSVTIAWITFAGPFLTYGLMWVAFWLMSCRKTAGQRAIGFALLFANLPLGRILPVLNREGDESFITRQIIQKTSMTVMSWGTEMVIVFLLTVPVLIRAWQLLHPKYRLFVFTGFLMVPLLAESVLMNKLANGLLHQGVLAGTGILGSPVLVNVWNALWLLVLVLTFWHLSTLLTVAEEKQVPARKVLEEAS